MYEKHTFQHFSVGSKAGQTEIRFNPKVNKKLSMCGLNDLWAECLGPTTIEL